MATRAFKQVDVFTEQPLRGNPVAVVLDADGLDAATMQHIARWTHLSETTFVLAPSQPSASYRVRIFTPASELPFAGHPSVGTAHALIEAGRLRAEPEGLVQECGAGLLPLRVEGEGSGRLIRVRAPRARAIPLRPDWAPLLDRALAGSAAGGLPPALYDNGPRWWLASLADEASVRGQRPRLDAIAALCMASGAVGLAVFADVHGADVRRVVRAYCPADGINEDPVTGSANAAIGAYLQDCGLLRAGEGYIASQGRELGRDGRVEVRLEQDGVWIGGQAVTVVDGSFHSG